MVCQATTTAAGEARVRKQAQQQQQRRKQENVRSLGGDIAEELCSAIAAVIVQRGLW